MARINAGLIALVIFATTACSLFSDDVRVVEGIRTAKSPMIRSRPIVRKLIEFGFDLPSADFVRANIREMERRPFDGIIFRPGPAEVRRRAFDLRPWTSQDLHLETLRRIDWRKFTDNFLHLYMASYSTMDWFDDAHWQTITGNLRLYREAIDACRCKGVAVDPEYYGGTNPWAYSGDAYPRHDFHAVQNQVRRRGAEFAHALQTPERKTTILFFFLLGYVRNDLARGIPLQDSRYALLPAFLSGILDAAQPGLTVVDGNEDAYHYGDTNQYFDAVTNFWAAKELIPKEVRASYDAHLQVGSSLFVDRVLTESPDEFRRSLWNHNVYEALATSERYVWCYSHDQDWWNGDFIPGSEEGIRSARSKLESLQPLGYDLRAGSSQSAVIREPSVELAIHMTRRRTLVAHVTGDEIARVNFYRAGRLAGSDQRPPYRLSLDIPPSPDETFIARVFDDNGRHGTSAPIRLTIKDSE